MFRPSVVPSHETVQISLLGGCPAPETYGIAQRALSAGIPSRPADARKLRLGWRGRLYESVPGRSPDTSPETAGTARHRLERHKVVQQPAVRSDIARDLAIRFFRSADLPARPAGTKHHPPLQKSNPRPRSGTESGRPSPDRTRTLQYFPKHGSAIRTSAPRVVSAQLDQN